MRHGAFIVQFVQITYNVCTVLRLNNRSFHREKDIPHPRLTTKVQPQPFVRMALQKKRPLRMGLTITTKNLGAGSFVYRQTDSCTHCKNTAQSSLHLFVLLY
jgi:hypothetical protein